MPRGMFDNRPQSEVDQEDQMIAAIKNRAITGQETAADVARINAGSAWLSGGTQAAVQGAGIMQGAATEQTKLRASMEELQRKAESEQQLEEMRQTGATGREQMTQTGQTLRGRETNATQLQGIPLTGLWDVKAQETANTGSLAVANRGAQAAEYGHRLDAEVGNNQVQASLVNADRTARSYENRATTAAAATVTAAQAKADAQRFAASQGKGGKEAEALIESYAKQVASIDASFLEPATANQLKATARAQFESDMQRIVGATPGLGANGINANPAGLRPPKIG